MNIQLDVRYTQDAFMTVYAQAYGVPNSTLSKWLEEEDRERRVSEVVKRFRVTAKQWDEWAWHERVAGIEAGFNPGRTRREAFEGVKAWFDDIGYPHDYEVNAKTLQSFDEQARARKKERLAKQHAERVEREREKKKIQREERIMMENALRRGRSDRKQDAKEHERRVRVLVGVIEAAEELVQEVINHGPRDIRVVNKMNAYYAVKYLANV